MELSFNIMCVAMMASVGKDYETNKLTRISVAFINFLYKFGVEVTALNDLWIGEDSRGLK